MTLSTGRSTVTRNHHATGTYWPSSSLSTDDWNACLPTPKRTRTISPNAVLLRAAIQHARRPDALLFEAIPEAFGLVQSQLDTPAILSSLEVDVKNALIELDLAYDKLLERIEERLYFELGPLHSDCRLRGPSPAGEPSASRLRGRSAKKSAHTTHRSRTPAARVARVPRRPTRWQASDLLA